MEAKTPPNHRDCYKMTYCHIPDYFNLSIALATLNSVKEIDRERERDVSYEKRVM
jgi:hypothetical protein